MIDTLYYITRGRAGTLTGQALQSLTEFQVKEVEKSLEKENFCIICSFGAYSKNTCVKLENKY